MVVGRMPQPVGGVVTAAARPFVCLAMGSGAERSSTVCQGWEREIGVLALMAVDLTL